MGAFTAGTVVLVRFPFSVTQTKFRPAVVIANCGGGEWLLCQVTSGGDSDPQGITLTDGNFLEGGLERVGYVRLGRLFTVNETLIAKRVGLLEKSFFEQVRSAILVMIKQSR
jgi:mRNA interferase MazF